MRCHSVALIRLFDESKKYVGSRERLAQGPRHGDFVRYNVHETKPVHKLLNLQVVAKTILFQERKLFNKTQETSPPETQPARSPDQCLSERQPCPQIPAAQNHQ